MKFPLTGKFNEIASIRGNKPHTGIDLAMPEGTQLRSIGDGVIDKVYGGSTSIGKGVNIEFPDGTHAIYGHMSRVKVHIGDKVRTGDQLGWSGNTGNSSGPHLHFSLKDSQGNFVDPTPIADKVADLSGEHLAPGVITQLVSNPDHQGILGKIIWHSTSSLREHAADMATEIALGICDALGDLLVGVSLIGSALCIILKVSGWKDGGRWAGILMCSNFLLKFLFGRGA